MTDEPDDIEASLDSLEATQKRGHRTLRRVILISLGALLALAALNATLVTVGGPDRWLMRNFGAIFGLTLLGTMGYVHTAHLYRMVVRLDAELMEAFRRQGQMAEALEGVRPLLRAIEDARAKGVGLLIPPGELPPAAGPPTVH